MIVKEMSCEDVNWFELTQNPGVRFDICAVGLSDSIMIEFKTLK
jgi:hypothetical protein